jgi:hypothetical protein
MQERLAKLVGGVAVIKVGAATETEMKEKKARVEDAMHATRAAVEEGIVPGGGVTLVRAAKALEKFLANAEGEGDADEQIGVTIVKRALEEPLRQIVQNAGKEGAVIVQNVRDHKKENYGYNAATETMEDLVEAGVIDPAKVTRTALQNAASIVGLMLMTEAMISEVPESEAVATVNEGDTGEYHRSSSTTGTTNPYFYSEGHGIRGYSDSFKPSTKEETITSNEITSDTEILIEEESSTPSPSFYFLLEGEGAKGNVVKYNSNVDLIFNYDVPEDEALATIQGQGLNWVKEQDLDLGISVTPKGFSFRDNRWYQVAEFRDGELKEPIRFFLKASNQESSDAGFYISFDVDGYILYQFHLSVELVRSVESGGKSSPLRQDLNLDLYKIVHEKESAEKAIGIA